MIALADFYNLICNFIIGEEYVEPCVANYIRDLNLAYRYWLEVYIIVHGFQAVTTPTPVRQPLYIVTQLL